MATDEDRDSLAAEYVLGTLDLETRADVEAQIVTDPDLAERVHRWERRLGELNGLVAPIEPPAVIWDAIQAKVAAGEASADVGPAMGGPQPRSGRAPTDGGAGIADLTRQLNRWRSLARWGGALAAALIALAAARELRPDLLPQPLRPRTVIQVVEKPVEAPAHRPAEFVAVLQQAAASPGFILTFDFDQRALIIRRLGAEPQTGKSYELWLVSDRLTAPRSLGVVGSDEFTTARPLQALEPAIINAATYAVSLEPSGGSPTGAPTGPILYSGRLVQATPGQGGRNP